ncbi:putative beta-N-acetylhexosaminidase [Streptomyces sp. Tu6071]|nr:putative beta-N-acetylhexosaminidase [Streptomyces sp. Tu6071]
MALDLDAPALVVGEVEVQDVELVRGEQVDRAQHAVLGQEVAGDIEEVAAPGEAGAVLDLRVRDLDAGRRYGHGRGAGDGGHRGGERCAAQGLGPGELAERLDAVVDPGGPAPGDADAFGADGQDVRLGGRARVDAQAYDGAVPGFREVEPERHPEVAPQGAGGGGGPRPRVEPGGGVEAEGAVGRGADVAGGGEEGGEYVGRGVGQGVRVVQSSHEV